MELSFREIMESFLNNQERINYIKKYGKISHIRTSHVKIGSYKILFLLKNARKALMINKELILSIVNELYELIINAIEKNSDKNIKDIVKIINYHKFFETTNSKEEKINFYIFLATEYSEENTPIPLAYTGDLGDAKNITIGLNEKINPKQYLEYSDELKLALTNSLIHEITHVSDISFSNSSNDKKEYFNSMEEIKALINELISDIEMFYVSEKVLKIGLEKILPKLPSFEVANQYLDDKSRKHIFQVLYNHFNEKESK